MKKWGWLIAAILVVLIVALCGIIFFPLLFMGGAISPFGEREIPAEYVPIYKAAKARYGVPWNLLAAHHRVETVFSALQPMISSVGVEGHMQFMPCTWVGRSHPSCYGAGRGSFTEEEKTSLAMIARYGGYGVDADRDGRASMWSLWDSIFSAANYLAKNGAATGRIYSD